MRQGIILNIVLCGALSLHAATVDAIAEDAAAPAAAAPATAAPPVPATDEGWEEVSDGLSVKVVSLTRTKHQTVKLKYRFRNCRRADI